MTQVLRIDAARPDERRLQQVVDILSSGGVIIYPTDSVYTLGCSIYQSGAYARVCALKGVAKDKAEFAIVCSDYSHMSQFVRQIDNSQFRLLKKYLPGPFTFILEASKEISKILGRKKKTVGFRIPDAPLLSAIITKADSPLFSASILIDKDSSYAVTADEIFDQYDGKVDLIIDGGICGEVPTTIVDLSQGDPEILRQGAGEF